MRNTAILAILAWATIIPAWAGTITYTLNATWTSPPSMTTNTGQQYDLAPPPLPLHGKVRRAHLVRHVYHSGKGWVHRFLQRQLSSPLRLRLRRRRTRLCTFFCALFIQRPRVLHPWPPGHRDLPGPGRDLSFW